MRSSRFTTLHQNLTVTSRLVYDSVDRWRLLSARYEVIAMIILGQPDQQGEDTMKQDLANNIKGEYVFVTGRGPAHRLQSYTSNRVLEVA